MKVKTSELIGPALDWAVAKAEGAKPFFASGYIQLSNWIPGKPFAPSTDWSQGGPIIYREAIATFRGRKEDEWAACISGSAHWIDASIYDCDISPTPLVAAMRCYVASKFGDEVDIPEELGNAHPS